MRPDAFIYEDIDRFPIDESHPWSGEPALGLVATTDALDSARAVAAEIARLLAEGSVRDRQTGVARSVRPGDIAILFRSREGHQQFESALEAEGIPSYVYKGLGFFDTDEVKDVVAVLRLARRSIVQSEGRRVPQVARRPSVRSRPVGARS